VGGSSGGADRQQRLEFLRQQHSHLEDPMSAPVGRRFSPAQIAFAAALGIGSVEAVIHAWRVYRVHGYLDHVAGSWATLAFDFAHGVLYRPLFSEIGFGGTRFMPLYFSGHAGLIAVGVGPIFAGYIVSAVAGLVVAFALASIFYKESRVAALVAVLAIFALPEFQRAVTTIRGDILAAALNLAGIAIVARSNNRRATLVYAPLLFGLAFMAKLTTLFGIAAVCFWLIAEKRRKDAWQFSLASVVVSGVLLAAFNAASNGRMLSIFAQCAGASMTWVDLLHGPLQLLDTASTYDFAALPLFAAALAVALTSWRRLSSFAFFLCLVATCVIYASPGTDFNHLLDLELLSVFVLMDAAIVTQDPSPRLVWFGTVVGMLCAATTFQLIRDVRVYDNTYAAQIVRSHDDAVLVENPIWSVMAEKPPVVADGFMFRVASAKQPQVGNVLVEILHRKKLSTVVLNHDLEKFRWWYETTQFGSPIYHALTENYRLAEARSGVYVYVPKD
jgi:hypothetical protein